MIYKEEISLLEQAGLKNSFDPEDLEKESNNNCHKLCQWKKLHNDMNPSTVSLNGEEKYLASWLHGKRAGKQGKGKGIIFYKSDEKISESCYGYFNLFKLKNMESESNDKCRELCQWMKNNRDKEPSKESSDKVEKILGIFLSNRKRAYKGKGHFYESDRLIAIDSGYSDLFLGVNLESQSNQMCQETCNWVKINNRKPSSRAKNPTEKKLGKWLGFRMAAKGGKGRASFYKSDLDIAVENGFPYLFIKVNKEQESNEICRMVCDYKKTHGDKNPPQTGKLGRWLSTRRKVKLGKTRGKFYYSDQIIAEKFGYNDLFIPGRQDRR